MQLPILILLASFFFNAGNHTVHVSADGSEKGNGSKKAPLRTLEQARDNIREGRANGTIEADEKVTVSINPGIYRIKESFELKKEDSGTPDAPVVYKARERGKVHLYGGVDLSPENFKAVSDKKVLERLDPEVRSKVLVCDVSEYAPAGGFPKFKTAYRGVPASPLLYVDGRMMTIARWPDIGNEEGGWAGFSKVVDTGKADPDSPEPAERKDHPGSFIFEDDRPLRWDIDKGVWLFGYWTHDWFDQVIRIASYDKSSKEIKLAAKHKYGIKSGTWGRKERRFYALNLLEELDSPGEWYLDREKGLLYFYPGEGFASAHIVLATLSENMIRITGAQHVKFRQINFEYGHSRGLTIKEAEDVHVEGCKVANFAAGGIFLRGSGCSVRSCDIFQIGRAGILVHGGDRKTLTRADNIIENNNVHHFGMFQRTYAAGIGLYGCGQIMRHNSIHDAPHAAVLYGGNEHLLEFNEVYRVVMETGDAGAFYTGRDWTTQGNILRHNYIHDLGGDADHINTMGFYFDDCDCGDEIIGNIFFRAGRAIMIGGGREHPVINNLIVECPIGLHIDARGMFWKNWNKPGSSWHLERKAERMNYKQPPWSEKYPRLARIMEDSPREPLYNPVKNNIFVDCGKKPLRFDKRVMSLMDKFEMENNLMIATASTNTISIQDGVHGFKTLNGTPDDPIKLGFKNRDEGDFRLRWWRPAIKRIAPDFKEIPFDRIGLYKDDFRKTLPEK
ncbi:MAG: right-handed parallel beta-helix repeat-containing protein [Kiritimatiellia bacterium]